MRRLCAARCTPSHSLAHSRTLVCACVCVCVCERGGFALPGAHPHNRLRAPRARNLETPRAPFAFRFWEVVSLIPEVLSLGVHARAGEGNLGDGGVAGGGGGAPRDRARRCRGRGAALNLRVAPPPARDNSIIFVY